MVSSAHNVCPKGYYIAIVSTIAEQSANNHQELGPGLDRLGKTEETFMAPPIPISEPLEDGTKDNIYISKSYDSTSHFETTTGKCPCDSPLPIWMPYWPNVNVDDIRDIYRRAEGEELVVEGLRETTNLVEGE